jgi:hypothetical protein
MCNSSLLSSLYCNCPFTFSALVFNSCPQLTLPSPSPPNSSTLIAPVCGWLYPLRQTFPTVKHPKDGLVGAWTLDSHLILGWVPGIVGMFIALCINGVAVRERNGVWLRWERWNVLVCSWLLRIVEENTLNERLAHCATRAWLRVLHVLAPCATRASRCATRAGSVCHTCWLRVPHVPGSVCHTCLALCYTCLAQRATSWPHIIKKRSVIWFVL